MEIAGFWIRMVAALIDLFVLICILFIITMIFLYFLSDGWQEKAQFSTDGNFLLNQFIYFLVQCVWFIPFWLWIGANPGKMICGLKIVNTDGSDITFKTAFLRVVGYSINNLVLGIGYLWTAFDKNKQGWHDKIAATYVIKVKDY